MTEEGTRNPDACAIVSAAILAYRNAPPNVRGFIDRALDRYASGESDRDAAAGELYFVMDTLFIGNYPERVESDRGKWKGDTPPPEMNMDAGDWSLTIYNITNPCGGPHA